MGILQPSIIANIVYHGIVFWFQDITQKRAIKEYRHNKRKKQAYF
jgi:hypothetical protein